MHNLYRKSMHLRAFSSNGWDGTDLYGAKVCPSMTGTRHRKRKEGNVLGALTMIAPVFGVLALLFAFLQHSSMKERGRS